MFISDLTKKIALKKGFKDKNKITQSELQTWIRNKHKILIEPCYLEFSCKGNDGFYCRIFKKKDNTSIRNFYCNISKSKKYEEALEKGLLKALKLII